MHRADGTDVSVRLGVSFLTAKGDKFEAKLKDMKAASDLIDKEIQTRGARTREYMSSF